MDTAVLTLKSKIGKHTVILEMARKTYNDSRDGEKDTVILGMVKKTYSNSRERKREMRWSFE